MRKQVRKSHGRFDGKREYMIDCLDIVDLTPRSETLPRGSDFEVRLEDQGASSERTKEMSCSIAPFEYNPRGH